MEPQFPGRALADDAVDDTDVEVQMRILPFGHTSAEPNRWMKVTAPKRAFAGALGEHSRSRVSSARSATVSTRPTSPRSRCKK